MRSYTAPKHRGQAPAVADLFRLTKKSFSMFIHPLIMPFSPLVLPGPGGIGIPKSDYLFVMSSRSGAV